MGNIDLFNQLGIVNFDCLKDIEFRASNDIRRVQEREDVTHLTDDMVNVVYHIVEVSKKMSLSHPSFSSLHSSIHILPSLTLLSYAYWFSHDDRLYRIYLSTENVISIQVDSFIGTEEEDETYTFNEFIEDYDAYYYLDLNTMTVKSLYNHKEYIIEEKK